MSYKIAVIVGSTRPNRNGRTIADWFMKTANHDDLDFELVDLAELDLPFLDEPIPPSQGKYEHDHTKAWSEKVASADGYVLVTSEYNHGPPAPLKNALDFLYNEWSRKPFAFVGYGGAGGTRAIMQLEQIVTELSAVPLRGAINIVEPWSAVQGDTLNEDYVKGNVTALLENLAWWTETLKAGRT